MTIVMYAPDTARIATPVGAIAIIGDDSSIMRIDIEPTGAAPLTTGTSSAVRAAATQIAEWFAGERTTFDLPLVTAATARGEALRAGMVAIGHGKTLGYGQLAQMLGSSARAIGQACARNPFPIVVPCHRVTNADGSLGAYSAGDGPTTKRWLLDFERRGRSDLLL